MRVRTGDNDMLFGYRRLLGDDLAHGVGNVISQANQVGRHDCQGAGSVPDDEGSRIQIVMNVS